MSANESTVLPGNQSTQMSFNNESLDDTGNQTTPISIVYTLKGLNDAVAKIYHGPVFLFAILIIPGIIGNLHVLHIYIYKKPKNNTRVYVTFLAIIDLLTCVVAFPYNIVNCLLPYMFYSDIACKFFTWLNGFVTMCSALSLLVIAIERYRKICAPFKTQVTIKYAKLSCLIVVVASSILSTPTLYLYGSTRIQTVHPAFYGYECFVRMELRDTNYPMIYNGGVLTISASLSTSLVVLYTLIGIHLWKQQVKMRKNNMNRFKVSSKQPVEMPHQSMSDNSGSSSKLRSMATSETIASEISSNKENTEPASMDKHHDNLINGDVYTGDEELGENGKLADSMNNLHMTNVAESNKNNIDIGTNNTNVVESNKNNIDIGTNNTNVVESNKNNIDIGTNNTNVDGSILRNTDEDQDKTNINKLPKPSNKPVKDDKMEQIKRNTYMFFLITLCYTLSYIPYPILRLYQIFNMDWYLALSLEAMMVFHTALCGLFINNVVNSFIYMICDRQYRQELKAVYAKIFCRE